ncbi:ABC transporter permease [Oxynema sp. CENA135]|uniref:ABC transporter permease n=1 Tax=Oxynema sp. CENA135 TaxID=984206 RepID=UPI00190C92FC|nr:ABC transporter permease [Oxynema sp. CENA135]MBK4732854.1 ABC transporter permease [Oxynema sp. CENA135]
MDILESIKMSVTTLIANKMRSGLTMLGIIIGNASVIATVGVGEGAQNFIASQLEGLGTNVLFVEPGSPEAANRPGPRPKTLVFADAQAIASQVPSVKGVAPELTGSELVKVGNQNLSVLVVGTTPDYPSVRGFELGTGRFITALDIERNKAVVVLGSQVADELFDENPLGKQIRLKNVSLEIIGVMQPKGSSFGTNYDETIFLPITTMANRIVGRTSPYGLEVTYISVAARDEGSMNAAQFQIENLLRLRHQITDEDDFTVTNQKDLMQTVDAISGALKLMLGAVASISLFVGGIGIMNIMLVSVTERTQEIGLRKAIGASQQDILIQFTIESIILAIAGGLVGTAIGVSGVLLVAEFTAFKAGVSWAAISVATGVSGGIGLFFGIVPARRAAQLDPIVALRTT